MCRYVALNQGIIEVRKEESRPASAEGSSSGEFVQRAFDLTTQDGLEGYWAQLAQMSVDYRCACLSCCSVPCMVIKSVQQQLLQHTHYASQTVVRQFLWANPGTASYALTLLARYCGQAR